VGPGPQLSATSYICWIAAPSFGSRYHRLWRTPIILAVLDAPGAAA